MTMDIHTVAELMQKIVGRPWLEVIERQLVGNLQFATHAARLVLGLKYYGRENAKELHPNIDLKLIPTHNNGQVYNFAPYSEEQLRAMVGVLQSQLNYTILKLAHFGSTPRIVTINFCREFPLLSSGHNHLGVSQILLQRELDQVMREYIGMAEILQMMELGEWNTEELIQTALSSQPTAGDYRSPH